MSLSDLFNDWEEDRRITAECPYWGDGKHHWTSDSRHDHRYSKTSTIRLKCKCGATSVDVSTD